MAVENKYNDQIESLNNAGKAFPALYSAGANVFVVTGSFEVAAADDNDSVYRAAKNLPPNMVVVSATVSNDAITGGTDYDFGIYEAGKAGVAKDADAYADGLDLSSAGDQTNLLQSLDKANRYQDIGTLAGDTIDSFNRDGYDLAFTANTVGTAAGTIQYTIYLAQLNP